MPIILDAAAKSAPGTVRIVNVASNGHTNAAPRGIDLQDINQVHGGPVSRYGSSKLANILHTKELARRYSTPLARATNTSLTAEKSGGGEIWAASLHPGMVNTYDYLPTTWNIYYGYTY
jgi:NAD(P)-dependent dehydrogenase (short-subunit alcohol dehydrogenase family)